jgi:hypothetical protein
MRGERGDEGRCRGSKSFGRFDRRGEKILDAQQIYRAWLLSWALDAEGAG